MANLITEKQRKLIRKDYAIRLFSVSLFVISLLGLLFLTYIVSYYLIISQEDIVEPTKLKSEIDLNDKENTGKNILQIVGQTTEELKVVELYNKNNLLPSVFFSKIIENKNSHIKITELSINTVVVGEGRLLVSGISQSRAGLVAFIEDLKLKAGFLSVESPISDFVKDKNISFTLNIKVKI